MNIKDRTLWIAFGAIAVLLIGRFLPHPANFSPVCAVMLFCGRESFKRPLFLISGLLIIFCSDVLLNKYMYGGVNTFEWISNGGYTVYLAYLIIALLGSVTNPRFNFKLIAVGMSASILFFLISNFTVWTGSTMYTQDMNGLMNCYIAGIPFLKNAIVGDILYAFILIGLYDKVLLPKFILARI